MSKKIVGYSYFGRSRGFQTVNGGMLPPDFPINNILDIKPSLFNILPGERLLRISRINQNNKNLQFITIYEHAKEKESYRSGTFVGATIALYDCVAPAEMILTILIGMVEYLNRYLNNDHERRFTTAELSSMELKEPRDFISLTNNNYSIPFIFRKESDKETFTKLDAQSEYFELCGFIHHALNNEDLYKYGELYASSNQEILLNSDVFHSLDIDLYYENTIRNKELELSEKEEELSLLEERQKKITTNLRTLREKEKEKLNSIESQKKTLNIDIESLNIKHKELQRKISELSKEPKIIEENEYLSKQLRITKEEVESKENKVLSLTKEIESQTINNNSKIEELKDEIQILNHQLKESLVSSNSTSQSASDLEQQHEANQSSYLDSSHPMKIDSVALNKILSLIILISWLFLLNNFINNTNKSEKKNNHNHNPTNDSIHLDSKSIKPIILNDSVIKDTLFQIN